MDRFTWGFAIGAVVLCVVALGSVLFTRAAPPPDPSTPAGVAAAYVLAVRDRDAERAVALLAPNADVGGIPPSANASNPTAQEQLRQQIAGMGRGSGGSQNRVRILDTNESGDTARVNVEVTSGSDGPPFFGDGGHGQTYTFELTRGDGNWRIRSAPPVYAIG